ncbi:hypothetical protein ACRALDRAFT_1071266 [Sodiomyces alcalophilus JCM 7366]|uniref:uncharacterized protein n=1 Tax=Sodiomyces alcalophilus JCM 7366 TaxID=591952 RepID=UPI0039B4A2F3
MLRWIIDLAAGRWMEGEQMPVQSISRLVATSLQGTNLSMLARRLGFFFFRSDQNTIFTIRSFHTTERSHDVLPIHLWSIAPKSSQSRCAPPICVVLQDSTNVLIAHKTVAPIHLLPRPGGPFERWRKRFWGMNFDAYLPIESYLLFRIVATHGVDSAGFAAASRELTNNEHIKLEPTYDPTRLTPDALRELFIYHIREEYADLTCPAGRPLPPQLPPIPHRELILDNFHKVVALVDKLWEKYVTGLLASVRDDERRYFELQAEIEQLEEEERQEQQAKAQEARQRAEPKAANQKQVSLANGVSSTEPGRPPAQGQTPVKSAVQPTQPASQPPPPTRARPSPPQIPNSAQRQPPTQSQPASSHEHAPRATPHPGSTTTAVPAAPLREEPPTVAVPTSATAPAPPPGRPSPKTAHQTIPETQPGPTSIQGPPATAAPATHATQGVPAPVSVRPQHPHLTPATASSPVLQPPIGAGQPPPRGLQSASPVPMPAVSPRPDASGRPKSPGPTPSAPTPTTLKWEKPYQPPAPIHAQTQARPAPLGQVTTTIHPTTSAPATPQPQHPSSQWYSRPTGQHPSQPQLHPEQQTRPHPSTQVPQGQGPLSQSQQTVLAPPQPPSQLAAPAQSSHTAKGAPDRAAIQPPQVRPASTPPIPRPAVATAPLPARQPQLQSQPSNGPTSTPSAQPRPIAAAPPTAPPTPTPAPQGQAALPQPHLQRPQHQTPALTPQYAQQKYSHQQFTPSPLAAQTTQQALGHSQRADAPRRPSSPYLNQPPRPALPPRLASHLVRSSSPSQDANAVSTPQTPASAPSPSFVLTGSGTRWAANSTPSTPRPPAQGADVPSPAFEPLSPVQVPAKPPAPSQTQSRKKASPKKVSPKKEEAQRKEAKPPARRGRPPRSAQKDAAPTETPSRAAPATRRRSVVSPLDELSMDDHLLTPRIKDEVVATPRRSEETGGDTTADESITSRRTRAMTATPMKSRMSQKRKRQSSSADLLAPSPPPPARLQQPPSKSQPQPQPQAASKPTHVLWTRQFGRISSSALDQISSHRCANQFANPIRERDAPGYKSLILQPQDIKSIRAAMTHGNRAATEAAKNLEGGDPGTPTVWLPMSDELLPPKSIINSEQLERELVHMFSNAIMYNLDPYRGVGNSFLKPDVSAGDHGEAGQPSTYRVDEDAVVRDSRIMFVEVERLLGDLRSAERDRSGLPPSANAAAGGGGSARAGGVPATPRGPATPAQVADDDVDELAGEGEGSVLKRRRIGTRA